MKRGFTLIEMIMVIAMIALVTTIVIANTRSISLNTRVKAAAGLILDTAKDTRSNSVAVKEFGVNRFPSYGLHVNTASPTSITVFADCVADDNDDGTIDDQDSFRFILNSVQCSGNNGFVESHTLPTNTLIKEINATLPSGAGMAIDEQTRVDILFLRPEPTIWITLDNGTLLPAGKVSITVGDESNQYEKTVTFYSTGEFFAE